MKNILNCINDHKYCHAADDHSGAGASRSSSNEVPLLDPNPTLANYFYTTNFSEKDRYDKEAPYNQAPDFSVPKGIGLPLTYNLDFDSFIKTDYGNNRETFESGYDLPLYFTLPNIKEKDSFQWDSFPAGEAQQFLVFSVEQETINNRSPYNGATGESVVLRAESSSETERPFTITVTVTPYNAGPIPHIHWAEDEAFIMLQGEMDSWIGDPTEDAYELYEFPEGNDVDGDNFPDDQRTPQLTANNVENYYYGHLMEGDGVFLPRGHAHAYRNASPNGDPLAFITIWSRTPGYPEGGIEEFFTLSDPLIGRFYDTADEAASYGNLYNKNVGSEDAISNQQRFVDYYNTFPEYYVAMSRNFGSFTAVESDSIKSSDGSALTLGGNWNPSIATDTGTFPTPPPAAWDETSTTPWIATPNTTEAVNYYTPPAPNAPSEAVNFSTPFDPKIIQRVALNYDPNNGNNLTRKEFIKASKQLAAIYSDSNGIESSDLLKPKSEKNTFEILTVWDRFSSLDTLKESADFKQTVERLKLGGEVTPTNSSVHNNFADNYETNAPEQMLLGKFEIKEGKYEQVLKISEKLRTKTIEESGNISFDYYFEKGSDTTIYFIEHYKQGSDIAFHLQQSYTTKFFEKFAKKLESGFLADGEVSIYPVNTPQSSIYIEQKNGIDTFKEMLDSMPDLSMKLKHGDSNLKRTAYITNGTDTSGFGTFLEFTNLQISESDWLYGIIEVDDSSATINGIEPGNSATPSSQWMNEAGSTANILFQTKIDSSSKSNPRNIQVNTRSHYIPFRTKAKPEDLFINDNFNPAVEIEIPQDGELKIKKTKGIIKYHDLNAEFGNVVQGMSKVTSILQENGHYVLDTTDQPRRDLTISFNGFEKQNAHDEISLIKTNEDVSKIYDYEKNKFTKITDDNLDSIIRYADQSESIDFTDTTSTVVGGFVYTPVIKNGNQYFLPFNTSTRITGSNSFEMNVNDDIYDFAIDFTKSNEMPILT